MLLSFLCSAVMMVSLSSAALKTTTSTSGRRSTTSTSFIQHAGIATTSGKESKVRWTQWRRVGGQEGQLSPGAGLRGAQNRWPKKRWQKKGHQKFWGIRKTNFVVMEGNKFHRLLRGRSQDILPLGAGTPSYATGWTTDIHISLSRTSLRCAARFWLHVFLSPGFHISRGDKQICTSACHPLIFCCLTCSKTTIVVYAIW